jgi:hypothetical protein
LGLVTAALAAGAKATDVQQAVGHETAGMTEHYNQGKERQARQAGRRIARRLPALSGVSHD